MSSNNKHKLVQFLCICIALFYNIPLLFGQDSKIDYSKIPTIEMYPNNVGTFIGEPIYCRFFRVLGPTNLYNSDYADFIYLTIIDSKTNKTKEFCWINPDKEKTKKFDIYVDTLLSFGKEYKFEIKYLTKTDIDSIKYSKLIWDSTLEYATKKFKEFKTINAELIGTYIENQIATITSTVNGSRLAKLPILESEIKSKLTNSDINLLMDYCRKDIINKTNETELNNRKGVMLKKDSAIINNFYDEIAKNKKDYSELEPIKTEAKKLNKLQKTFYAKLTNKPESGSDDIDSSIRSEYESVYKNVFVPIMMNESFNEALYNLKNNNESESVLTGKLQALAIQIKKNKNVSNIVGINLDEINKIIDLTTKIINSQKKLDDSKKELDEFSSKNLNKVFSVVKGYTTKSYSVNLIKHLTPTTKEESDAIRFDVTVAGGFVGLSPKFFDISNKTKVPFGYLALRYYLRPVDKRVIESYLVGDKLNKVSLFIGVSNSSISYKGTDLQSIDLGFSTFKPVFGIGYDVTKYFSIDIGVLGIKQHSLSTVDSKEIYTIAPFFALSLQIDVFNRFKTLFNNSTYSISTNNK